MQSDLATDLRRVESDPGDIVTSVVLVVAIVVVVVAYLYEVAERRQGRIPCGWQRRRRSLLAATKAPLLAGLGDPRGSSRIHAVGKGGQRGGWSELVEGHSAFL